MAQEQTNKIADITDEVSLWGDKHQYIIRFKNKDGSYRKHDNWYFPEDLEIVFRLLQDGCYDR